METLTTKQTVLTNDMFSSFVNYLDVSTKTLDTYSKAIKQFIEYLKETDTRSPQREDVISYREYLKESHKPSTVQLYITAIRLFFEWTEQESIYPNIATHIKGARIDKGHKKDTLTGYQVKKVLNIAKGETEQAKRDYAILSLMFTGGLRTIEVSRANIEDMVKTNGATLLYIQGKGRDEKSEFIKLMPEVVQAIESYLATRAETDGKQPLFTSTSNNSKGARLTTRSISGLVKQAFINAGYDSDRLTAHSTRHTAVTLALLGGQSLQEVQQFARHSNIATTQIYAHNLDRLKNGCESTIAQAIF